MGGQMIDFIRKKLEQFITAAKLKVIEKNITKTGYNIADTDTVAQSFLLDLGDGIGILLSLNEKHLLRFEAAIIFDGELLNLKTYNDIANIFYTANMCVTGMYPQGNGKVKFYASCTTDFARVNQLGDVLIEFHSAIILAHRYIKLRETHTAYPMLDLSMFESIDVYGFNPKDLGEKKDFIFGNWNTFVSAIVHSHEAGELTSQEAAAILMEIKACESFESKNKMLLSEIGEVVWQEIVWNRNLQDQLSDEDKTYIN